MFKKMVALVTSSLVAVAMSSTAHSSIVLDTFDEEMHTLTSACGSTNSAGVISTIGGVRQLVACPSTVNANVTPGQWDFTGTRGDFRYGSGPAALAELNLDWSAYDQFEFDITSATLDTGSSIIAQVSMTADGSTSQDPSIAITTTTTGYTLYVPFEDVMSGVTTAQLMNVDGMEGRFFVQGGTGSVAVTEWRVSKSLAVPEPSTFVLSLLGLATLAAPRRKK